MYGDRREHAAPTQRGGRQRGQARARGFDQAVIVNDARVHW
jgi:hypothetical protein